MNLAVLGQGRVSPNPLVGAVLVHGDRIIGEGWHREYGQAHAEVNCIHDAVSKGHASLLRESTLYVNLEPCAHMGKTPPCADLIIQSRIPRVVIANRDPFELVDGQGIEKLEKAGVAVILGIEEDRGTELNKRFFRFHLFRRPYVVLKWAQTAEGIMGITGERLSISNEITNRLVHRWRGEEAAIMIAVNTAMTDNPLLTNRLASGPSPIRILLDPHLRAHNDLRLFKSPGRVLVFNYSREKMQDETPGQALIQYLRIRDESPALPQVLQKLHELGIQSLLVEGGAKLLQTFIAESSWDEARVIRGKSVPVVDEKAVKAPVMDDMYFVEKQCLRGDEIHYYANRS